MAKKMTDKTKMVYEYLMDNQDADLTAPMIAEALDMPVRSANSVITSGLQNKGYTTREEVATLDADGKEVKVKYIRLTDEGLNYEEDIPEDKEEDAE